MKKRLVFFVYVDAEYKESKIYDVHFYNLKRFKDSFDCYTFWLSLKNFNDENLEFANKIIGRLMGCGFTKNTDYKIYENDTLREARCFNDEVVEKINGEENELIFFGHTKGLSNEFNDSLLLWICSMYYFCLNFNDKLDNAFSDKNNHIAFYGFPLMDYSGLNLIKNDYMYAGTFFWTNTETARKIKEYYDIKFSDMEDRAYAENFPGNHFKSCFCRTHTTKAMPFWGLYYFYRDFIGSNFVEKDEDAFILKQFIEFYNKMLKELNIVL